MALGIGGTVVGRTIVEMVGDNSKLKRDFEEAHASAATATSGISAKSAAMSAAVAAAAIYAGEKLLEFSKEAVQAWREHEVVVAEFQAAIARNPGLVDANTAALQAEATALQNVTGKTDEQILSAETALSRFVDTEDQLKTLTPLVLDYAQATGTTAEEAAGRLGRALLGNARALKAIGIDFKATGNREVDVARITDLLKEKVGGLAEEFGQTSAGRIAIFNARMNDLQETAGHLIVQGLDPLVRVGTEVLALFQSLPIPIQQTIISITGLVTVFGLLAVAVASVKRAMQGLGLAKVAEEGAVGAEGAGLLARALTGTSLAVGAIVGVVVGYALALKALNTAQKQADEITQKQVQHLLALPGSYAKVQSDLQLLTKLEEEHTAAINTGDLDKAAQLELKMADAYARLSATTGDAIDSQKQANQLFIDAQSELDSYEKKIAESNGPLGGLIGQLYDEAKAGHDVGEEMRILIGWQGTAGVGWKTYDALTRSATGITNEQRLTIAALSNELELHGGKLGRVKTFQIQAALAAGDFETAEYRLSAAVDKAGGSADSAVGKISALAEAHRIAALNALAQNAAENQLAGSFLGVEGAMIQTKSAADQLQKAQNDLHKLAKAGKKGTEDYRDAQLAVRQAQLQGVQAQLQLNDAVNSYGQKITGPVLEAQKAYNTAFDKFGAGAEETKTAQDALTAAVEAMGPAQDKAIRQIESYGRKAGLTDGQVQGLVDRVLNLTNNLKGVPDTVSTKITLDDQASNGLYNIRQLLNQIGHPTNVSVLLTRGSSATGSIFPRGMASGAFMTTGPTIVNGHWLVGEGGYSTRFGKGSEAVLPLTDDRLHEIGMAIASTMGSGSSLDVGSLSRVLSDELARALPRALSRVKVQMDSRDVGYVQARSEIVASRRR